MTLKIDNRGYFPGYLLSLYSDSLIFQSTPTTKDPSFPPSSYNLMLLIEKKMHSLVHPVHLKDSQQYTRLKPEDLASLSVLPLPLPLSLRYQARRGNTSCNPPLRYFVPSFLLFLLAYSLRPQAQSMKCDNYLAHRGRKMLHPILFLVHRSS